MQLQPEIPQAEEPVIPANWRRYEGRVPAYCSGNTTIYVDCQDPRWRQWDGAKQLGRKRHRMPVVARPRWQVVVVSNRGLQAMLVPGQAGPLQGLVAVGQAIAAASRDPPGPRRQSAPCTANPATAAHRDCRHNTEGGLDPVDPGTDERGAADGCAPAVFARAAAIASQADEAVEVVDAALDHSSHCDRAGGRRITVSTSAKDLVQELQKTVNELAGTPGRPSRSNGGQHHAVVTPRTITASPSIRNDVALMRGAASNDSREAVSPVMTVAREAADARAIPAHHQPIAVMLDFVNPERAGRWQRHLRRLAWLDEAGWTLQDHDDHSLGRSDLTATTDTIKSRTDRSRLRPRRLRRLALHASDDGYDFGIARRADIAPAFRQADYVALRSLPVDQTPAHAARTSRAERP
jgi:hypothetical protein